MKTWGKYIQNNSYHGVQIINILKDAVAEIVQNYGNLSWDIFFNLAIVET